MAKQRTLVISDTHFRHKNITKFRTQFSSVEEHDDFILESILNTVTIRDTLWLLGDICFTKEGLEYLRAIADNVGRLNIVLGNHDLERQGINILDYAIFTKNIYGLRQVKGGAWLSHAPIHPDELRESINVHGHMHDRFINDTRYANVCCEMVNYKPVLLNDIIKKHKNIIPLDENNTNYSKGVRVIPREQVKVNTSKSTLKGNEYYSLIKESDVFNVEWFTEINNERFVVLEHINDKYVIDIPIHEYYHNWMVV